MRLCYILTHIFRNKCNTLREIKLLTSGVGTPLIDALKIEYKYTMRQNSDVRLNLDEPSPPPFVVRPVFTLILHHLVHGES